MHVAPAAGAPVWRDERVVRGVEAQLRERRRLLAEGHAPVGWKVALGAPETLAVLGTDGPVVGFLTSATQLDHPARCPVGRWTKPALEPEIAVHLGASLGAEASREEAAAAISGLGPAVELADVDVPAADDLTAVVAGNIYHRAVVLGPPHPAGARGDLAGTRASVVRDGSVLGARDDPAPYPPDVRDLVRHVARFVAAFGERLEAGEVIITGAVLPLVSVAPGERVTYELDPFGRLEVELVD